MAKKSDFTISLVAGIDLASGGIENEAQFRKAVSKEFEKLSQAISLKEGKIKLAPKIDADIKSTLSQLDKAYKEIQTKTKALRARLEGTGPFEELESALGLTPGKGQSAQDLIRKLDRRSGEYQKVRDYVIRSFYPDAKQLSAEQKKFGDLLLRGTDETISRVAKLSDKYKDAVFGKRLVVEAGKDLSEFNTLLKKSTLNQSELKKFDDITERLKRYREALKSLSTTLRGGGADTAAAAKIKSTLADLEAVERRATKLQRESRKIVSDKEEQEARRKQQEKRKKEIERQRREREKARKDEKRRAEELERDRQKAAAEAARKARLSAGRLALRRARYDIAQVTPGELPVAQDYVSSAIKGMKDRLAAMKVAGMDQRKETAATYKQLEKLLAKHLVLQKEISTAVNKYKKDNDRITAEQKRQQELEKEQLRIQKEQQKVRKKLLEGLKKARGEYEKMQAAAKRLRQIQADDLRGFEGRSAPELRAQRQFVEAQMRQRLQQAPNLRGAARARVEMQAAELAALSDRLRQAEMAASSFKKSMGEAGRTVRQFFRYAIGYGALYRLLTAFGALSRSVVELDKELKSLQAISAATADEMISVEAAVKNVATTTKFSVGEIARAARVLAQAGVQPEEITTTLKAVAEFAAGTETSIETAADLLSTMRNVYKELDDFQLADKLTKAINISKLTGDDLKVILSISAQVSKAMNLSAEQYLAAVTTLRNAGLKASTVATGLRQGLLELFSPDTKLIKALQTRYAQIGEAQTAEDIRTRFQSFKSAANPLLAVLRELQRLGFTGAGKKTLTRAFDIRAENAINALIDNVDKIEAAAAALSVGGASAEASATQLNSLANAWDNLGAAITVVTSDISDTAIPVLTDIVKAATEAVNALDEVDRKARAAGGTGLAAALPYGVAGGILGTVLGRGISGKFLLGTAGAVGGTALGVGGQAAIAETGNAKFEKAVDAIGFGALVVGFAAALFRKLPKSLIESAKFAIKGGGTAAKVASTAQGLGLIGTILASISKLGDKIRSLGFIKKLAPFARGAGTFLRFLPGIGTLVSLATTIYAVFKLFGASAEDQAKKLAAQLSSLRRLEEQQKQDLDRIRAAFSEFALTDLEKGRVAKTGTTAAKYEAVVNSYLVNRQRLAEYLGADLEDLDSVAEVLRDLSRGMAAQAGTESRNARLKELAQRLQLDAVKDNEVFAVMVNQFVGSFDALKAQFTGLLESYRRAKESKNKTEMQKALIQAFESVASDKDFVRMVAAIQAGSDKAIIEAGGAEMLSKLVGRLLMSAAESQVDLLEQQVVETSSTLVKEADVLVSKLRIGAEKGDTEAAVRGINEFLLRLDLTTKEGKAGFEALTKGLEELATNLENPIAALSRVNASLEQLDKELAGPRGGRGASRRRSRLASEREALLAERERLLGQQGAARTVVLTLQGAAAEKGRAAQQQAAEQARQARNQFFDLVRQLTTLGPRLLDTNQFKKNLATVGPAGQKILGALKIEDQLDRQKAVMDVLGELTNNGRVLSTEFHRLAAVTESAYEALQLADPKVIRSVVEGLKTAYLDANPEIRKRQQIELLKAEEERLKATKQYGKLLADGSVMQKRQQLEIQLAENKVKLARENLAKVSQQNIGDTVDAEKKRDAATKKLIDAEQKLAEIRRKQAKETLDLRLKYGKAEIDAALALNKLQQEELKQKEQQVTALGDATKVAEIQKQLSQLELEALQLTTAKNAAEETNLELLLKRNELEQKNLREAQRQRATAANISALAQSTGNLGPDMFGSLRGIRYKTNELEIRLLTESVNAYIKRLDELRKLQAQAFAAKDTKSVKSYGDEIKNVSNQLADMRDRLREINTDVKEQMQLLTDSDGWLMAFEQLDSRVGNLAENIRTGLVGGIDAFGEALGRTIMEGENFGKTFRKALASIFADLGKNITKTFLTDTITRTIKGYQQAKAGGSFFDAFSTEPDQAGKAAEGAADVAVNAAEQGNLSLQMQVNSNAVQANTSAIMALNAALSGKPINTAVGGGSSPVIAGAAPAAGEALKDVAEGQQEGNQTLAKGFTGMFDITKWSTGQIVGAIGGLALMFRGLSSSKPADRNKQLLGGLALTALSIWTGGISNIGVQAARGAAKGAVSLTPRRPRGYARGSGIIKGPGTGTSDSVPAILVGKGGVEPIRLSAGESILTAQATKLLGENTIRALNAGRIKKFATGAESVAGAQPGVAVLAERSAANSPEVTVNPNIVNVLDPSVVEDFVTSEDGQDVIVNVIQKNRNRI